VLDELRVERAAVYGISGAAPYILALAARHPERVESATILVGAAPLLDEEASQLIGLNAESHRLADPATPMGCSGCSPRSEIRCWPTRWRHSGR
jgi:pimeloyl-ACP methyl ester carboxylesterase